LSDQRSAFQTRSGPRGARLPSLSATAKP
jgi:hypothetical protein